MSDEGRANGSTYSSQFRNLFGDDGPIDGDDSGKNKNGGSYSVGSVEPSSLFSQEPMLEERSRTQNNTNDITPSILLEQLAYVDNFIPSLEQDFANLDSWILQDSGGDTNSISVGGNNGSGERLNDGGLGFDGRLAAELSAFADESFIFPDEDKRIRGTDDDKDNNNDIVNENENDKGLYEGSYEYGNSDKNNNDQDGNVQVGKRSAHFLTQRRNTFLTSQYDHSKSRFSSKSKRKKDDGGRPQELSSSHNQDIAANNVLADSGAVNSPLEDHGGFTNVDIISGGNGGGAAGGANDDMRSPRFSQSSNFPPSPLSNILASQALQPYSVSASPAASTKQSDHASITSHTQGTTTNSQNYPQIHVPDYSTIPTSTLVALLPKVSIPSGAYRTLVDKGFSEEQIQAISAIIAHHEQEKLKQRTGGNLSANSSSDDVGEQDTTKSAEFLLGILTRESSPREGEQQGLEDSILQLNRARSESHDNDKCDDSMEVKEEERESEDDSIISSKSLKRGGTTDGNPLVPSNIKRRTTDENPLVPSKIKRRNVSVADIVSGPSTAIMQVPKSHQRRKLKEKELVNSVTELSELAISLQQKIHTLEMENKLLKNLFRSSGELEGIEKAENIKKRIMDKISSSNDD